MLNEMYARRRLEQIDEKGKHHLLYERYMSERLGKLERKRRYMVMSEKRVQRLFEAITTKQLQDYLGWFQMIKNFVSKHELPSLKSATDRASNEIMDLFRGAKKGPKGVLNKVRSLFRDKEVGGDDDRLNSVNHFLWGITTVVSSLPTLLQALDAKMDGKLLDTPKPTQGRPKKIGEAEGDVEPPTIEPPMVKPGAGQKVADFSLSLEDNIRALSPDEGDKFVDQFRDLVGRSLSQAVARFDAGKIPFITDPAAVANDILKMELNDVQTLGKDALNLKDQWEPKAEDLTKTAEKIHTSAESDTATGEEPTKIDIGRGLSFDLSDKNIDDMTNRVNQRLRKLKQDVTGGANVSSKMKTSLARLKRAMLELT